ncbi:hypothetical protein KC669_03245 [Candidatus Dojkabacteria bacterium]|uniref:Uncharacterized protein n=1 Tax=Candidatus Dojkabacteria bacterium TaxID=2099670 RepID=A0A955RLF7_9BACT|nr:hypothetical protein [Candidatus Dojkabacteria bacterium]
MNESLNSSMLVGLVLAISVVIILAFVVVKQSRRINYLEKPKYGFMGKTLSVALVLLFSIASLISVYINQYHRTPTSISVTDKSNFMLEINYTVYEESTNLYYFNIVPRINNKIWGESTNVYADVLWIIKKNDTEIEKVERNLNINHQGGILEYLEPGTNQIEVRVIIENQVLQNSVIIQI